MLEVILKICTTYQSYFIFLGILCLLALILSFFLNSKEIIPTIEFLVLIFALIGVSGPISSSRGIIKEVQYNKLYGELNADFSLMLDALDRIKDTSSGACSFAQENNMFISKEVIDARVRICAKAKKIQFLNVSTSNDLIISEDLLFSEADSSLTLFKEDIEQFNLFVNKHNKGVNKLQQIKSEIRKNDMELFIEILSPFFLLLAFALRFYKLLIQTRHT